MQIKLKSSVIVNGKGYAAGAVVPDAPDKDARYLIATGAAEVYEPPKKAAAKKKAPTNKAIAPDEIVTR